ncbi:MAG: hypothetical protein UU77_C0070G0007 [candidate division WWE3 bacterium GW2011_GWC1_41_7]|uniref:Uncharacterized protein n=1 Tax=candidate division WWE3 bacterium GW2011_GWC1_41_7 TaxID=1619119 RepID=A0A0G0X2Q8_UNCKA|nr:MAG: hypothetical protein UU77_C0070G0007 [candidate division WWE3 bacterium GW2011_GWC1_41_7]
MTFFQWWDQATVEQRLELLGLSHSQIYRLEAMYNQQAGERKI